MMLKYSLFICALLTTTIGAEREERRQKHVDPFAALDKQISHTLAFHYLWPWSQLFKAAAALDLEDSLEEPQLVSDANNYQIKMYAKNFKPDELKVRVKNRNIIIEGKHKESTEHQHFMTNHFVQRFVLPPGSKQEEVTAVLNEKGVLIVNVPRHEVPPPPPEREVPIEVKLPAVSTETPDKKKDESKEPVEVSSERPLESVKPLESSSMKPIEYSSVKPLSTKKPEVSSSSATPLEQLELVEATTHVGKIRKKELKETTKTAKDNEVTKGVDGNGLDYALIDSE